ncbi:hypothetical protein F4808DRAFT_473552 [Astrocystis sublimbata]|nr:hypothetical protein F4808DRAFT_473552 [Astrocystis sublimbata]
MTTSVRQYHNAMKASLLLKDGMPDFLSSAPLVVSLLGNLRLLGWTAAATVNFERRKDSLFESNRMSPNLIQLHQQGRKMFETCDDKMSEIELTIQGLFSQGGTANAVFENMRQATAGQKLALPALNRNMEKLRDEMNHCSTEAEAIKKEIEILRDMSSELEMASVNELSTLERSSKDNATEFETLQRDEANMNETMARLDQALLDAKKSHEVGKSDVQQARRKVGGLHTFGLVALTSTANPILKTISHATDLVKTVPDLVGKFASPSFSVHRGSGASPQSNHQGAAPKAPSQRAVARRTNTVDKVVWEKAYEISTLVTKVEALLDDDDPESGIDDCRDMVQQLLNAIQPRSLPSQNAYTILDGCKKILMDMLKSHKSSIDLNKTDSKTQLRQNWRDTLKKLSNSAAELVTKAESQPGTAFGVNAPIFDPKATPLISSDGSIDANAFLAKRHEDLARTEMLCSTAMDNFQKMADQRANTQAQVIQITRKLTRLQSEKITADEIRSVLQKAGQALMRLQTKVQEMLEYFKSISRVLQRMHNFGVQPFVETVQGGISLLESGQDMTFSEFEAQAIYTAILTLRGHAGALASNCSFYLEVSRNHLRPLSDEISMLPIAATEDQRQAAAHKLEAKLVAASEAISTIGRQRIMEMQKPLEEIGKASHKNRQELPELPISQINTIEATVKTISAEQGELIEATDDLGISSEDWGSL